MASLRFVWVAACVAGCAAASCDGADPVSSSSGGGRSPGATGATSRASSGDATTTGHGAGGGPGSATGTGSGAGAGASGGGGAGGAAPQESSHTRYLAGQRHSPMSAAVVVGLRAAVAASPGRHDVFAKVGDSITVTSQFLGCFIGGDVDYGGRDALEPTRALFAETLADGSRTSFDRTTLAATVGWSAGAALSGNPTPIAQEVAAIQPAFAVIMFGTNDNYAGGQQTFEKNLLADVDALIGLGVTPIMSTVPPRGDDAAADGLVPEFNAIVRAVAQHRQVPLVDFYTTLVGLPAYGLSGDGVHPASYFSDQYHSCWFTDAALEFGMNQRNLITLEGLDRVRRFVLGAEAPEAASPELAGAGTLADPLVVDGLPFVDDRDTSAPGVGSAIGAYACAPEDEGGPEIVYRVDLAAPTKLRATVYVDAGVDVDLHWLTGPSADACVARDDKTLDLTAGPGTFYLVADTYVSGGVALSGAYRLTVVEVP